MDAEIEIFKLLQIRPSKQEIKEDRIIKEVPLTIFINQEELITLLCTPKDLEYLAVGFLFAEGFITKREDIKDILLDREKNIIKVDVESSSLELAKKHLGKRLITSGCAKGVLFYNLTDLAGCSIVPDNNIIISSAELFNLLVEFQKSSMLFKQTGGVHSCALCQANKIIKFKEDIGRHNALDKVLGECFLEGIPADDKIILITGRISSEILIKASKYSIPIIASLGAPTDLAISLAQKLNITLIGFLRSQRMNIYTGRERILISDA